MAPTDSQAKRGPHPGPLLRQLFHAPVWLYSCGLGRVLGHRFLLLTHIGRRTGRRRRTVLEVMEYRPCGPEFVVMCALGGRADWLRNIEAAPDAEISSGPDRFIAAHRILSEHEAVAVIAGYERRSWLMAPLVRAGLSWLSGWRYDSSAAARQRLARQLPLIAFRPL